MNGIKEPLALGFELSSFIFISYWVHPSLAQWLNWDSNLVLTGLFGISLIVWTFHAWIYVSRKDQ